MHDWSKYLSERGVLEFARCIHQTWFETPKITFSDVFIEYAGSRPCILCDFLLPWWICWAEIPLIFPDLISDETFRELTLAAMPIFPLYIFPFPWLLVLLVYLESRNCEACSWIAAFNSNTLVAFTLVWTLKKEKESEIQSLPHYSHIILFMCYVYLKRNSIDWHRI